MKDDFQLGLTRWNMSVQWMGHQGWKLAKLHALTDSKNQEVVSKETLTPLDIIKLNCGSNDLTSDRYHCCPLIPG